MDGFRDYSPVDHPVIRAKPCLYGEFCLQELGYRASAQYRDDEGYIVASTSTSGAPMNKWFTKKSFEALYSPTPVK